MPQNNTDLTVTIAIATFNSEQYLEKLNDCLIMQQNFDSSISINAAIFDGGSTDMTLEIATRLGFEVYENLRGDAISAKSLAINTLSSKYVVFLDHDEFLIQPESIARKVWLMENYPKVKAVLTEGYQLSSTDHTSNFYASEFGDPVSAFVHRTSSLVKHRKASFDSRMSSIYENKESCQYLAEVGNPPILCELVACGSMISREYFLGTFNDLTTEPDLVPHLFYLLATSGLGDHIAILKNDPVSHSTSTSWSQVFKKIRWRVQNRWSINDSVSQAGFVGRTALIAESRKENHTVLSHPNLRTFLFIPYVVLVIPCAIDAIRLVIQRQRIGYLMHFVLSVYVIWTSLQIKIKQIFGLKEYRSRYDGTER